MSELFSQFQDKNDILNWVKNEANFSRSEDEKACVFHSGMMDQNKKTAEAVCQRHNYITLEKTKDGEKLDKANLWTEGYKYGLSEEDVKEIWQAASEKYADQASGKVYCYVQGAREESIFIEKELPILLGNDKVTHINEIPREELQGKYETKQKSLHDIHREVSYGIKEVDWDGYKEPASEKMHRCKFEVDGRVGWVEFKGENYKEQMAEMLTKIKQAQEQTEAQSRQQQQKQ